MIQSLKYENRSIHDINEIKKIFIQNFNDLYVSNNNINFSFNDTVIHSTHKDLCSPPSSLDISNALKRIGPEKAPGPDGLNAHFFPKILEKCWSTYDDSY